MSLRELARRDDAPGMLLSYAQATLITSGPWLMTVAAVAAVSRLGLDYVDLQTMAVFRSILIYNFALSLVLSGPVLLVATRFLADSRYSGADGFGRGILVSALALVYGVGASAALPFYGLASDLAPAVRIAAVANYFVVAGIWVGAMFQVEQRDIRTMTGVFAVGLAAAVAASIALSVHLGMAGLVWGFTGGLAIVKFALVADVLHRYPGGPIQLTALLGKFRPYRHLAAAGIAAPVAVWGDKWVMWLSQEGRAFGGFMRQYPLYDSTMFLAFLTMVPTIALFAIFLKKDFLQHYRAFYRSIEQHDTWEQIGRNHRRIVRSLMEGSRRLLVLQAVVSATAVVLAPGIIKLAGLHYVQIGMFRLGTLGAGFHIGFLCISILLLYFDLRRPYLWLQLLFAVMSIALTAALLPLGFPFYGLGYFTASVLGFGIALVTLHRAVARLPYLTFVANNPSVR
jgi:polysaccharide biosynthesis protein PelG